MKESNNFLEKEMCEKGKKAVQMDIEITNPNETSDYSENENSDNQSNDDIHKHIQEIEINQTNVSKINEVRLLLCTHSTFKTQTHTHQLLRKIAFFSFFYFYFCTFFCTNNKKKTSKIKKTKKNP